MIVLPPSHPRIVKDRSLGCIGMMLTTIVYLWWEDPMGITIMTTSHVGETELSCPENVYLGIPVVGRQQQGRISAILPFLCSFLGASNWPPCEKGGRLASAARWLAMCCAEPQPVLQQAGLAVADHNSAPWTAPSYPTTLSSKGRRLQTEALKWAEFAFSRPTSSYLANEMLKAQFPGHKPDIIFSLYSLLLCMVPSPTYWDWGVGGPWRDDWGYPWFRMHAHPPEIWCQVFPPQGFRQRLRC